MNPEDCPGTIVVGWVYEVDGDHEYVCPECHPYGRIGNPTAKITPIPETEAFDHAIECYFCDREIAVKREEVE